MPHERKQIRDFVAGLLASPSMHADISGVYPSRQARVHEEEKAVILVYTKSETVEVGVAAPREYQRTLKLAVEIARFDGAADDVDDFLDEIALEIEKRILKDETMGGLVADTLLSDTEIDFVADSEKEIGACRLTFDVIYQTQAPREDLTLDSFERYHADFVPPNATPDTVPVVDETELPQ